MAQINKDELVAIKAAGASQDEPGATLLGARSYAPNFAAISKARVISQIGLGQTVGKFDPSRISYLQKWLMSRTDPMIRLGLHYTKVPLVNAPWHMECEDPQVAAFADNALRPIYTRLIMGMLTSLDFGYSGLVKNFKVIEPPDWEYEDDQGKIKKVWPSTKVKPLVWDQPDVLPANGAQPLFEDDGRTFKGIGHAYLFALERPAAQANVVTPNDPYIPAPYSLWMTNEREAVFGDWYGWPATAAAFRYWWSYWYRWLMGDRHFEADADPPIIVYGPADERYSDPRDPTGQTQISSQELGLLIAEAVRSGSALFMPSDMYVTDIDGKMTANPKWRVDVLRNAENMDVFESSFKYTDVMKLRALLVPEAALIPSPGMSRGGNVASSYGGAFAESEGIKMGELDQLINDHMIPDLLAQNFINPPPCRKVTTGFREEDLTAANNLLTVIAQQDLRSLDLDVRKLVKNLGLPQIAADAPDQAGTNFDPTAGSASDQAPPPPYTPAPGADTTAGSAQATGAIGGSTVAGGTGFGAQAVAGGGGLQVVGFSQDDGGLELPDGVPAYDDPEVAKLARDVFHELDQFLEQVYTDATRTIRAAAGDDEAGTLHLAVATGQWNPDLHPRWPGKTAGGKGGEFMQIQNIISRIGSSLSGSVNVSFLARGSRNISTVEAFRHGDGVRFDVGLNDGRHGSLVADANTDMSKIVGAMQQIDDGTIKRQIQGAERNAREGERQAKKDAARAPSAAAMKGIGPPSPEATLANEPSAKEIEALVHQAENDPKLSAWPPPKGEVGRSVLGDYHSTRDLWTNSDGRYAPERKALHDQIISSFIGNHQRQEKQIILFTAGGPASGKSTGGSSNPDGDILPPDAVKIDVDLIRAWLPEYRMMRAERDGQGNIIKHGDPAIASATHDESTDIARELTRIAKERRLNIVVDGTGNSFVGKFEGKMRGFKDAGYEVHAAMFDVPTDKAVQRAVVRAYRTDRFLPPKFVRDKHRTVVASHIGWRNSDAVDKWTAYSTDVPKGAPVIKMAEGGAGAEPTIHQPELYQAMLDKAGQATKGRSDTNYDSYKEPSWLKRVAQHFTGGGQVVTAGAGVPRNPGVQAPRLGSADAGAFQPGDAVYDANGEYLGSFVGLGPDGRLQYRSGGVTRTARADTGFQRRQPA